ncbi:MAG: gluconate 2-dehydrogenase subunit 3 family protein [Crocinitomicaceae bacterium]|nr:gluconate 2-dehydrogenase subunit 3 family protein [Crocinitomicaceae bacterium]MBK8926253.1 gluconate 2-dehydrogenase subunit 3 family protein [Crocinitomicaceae bacterium]
MSNPSKNKLADTLFEWQTNRREIIRAGLIAGTLSQISFLEACTSSLQFNGNKIFTARQEGILKFAMEVLFPADGNGPSCSDINAFDYITWVQTDEGAYEKNKTILTEGMEELDNFSKKIIEEEFSNGTPEQQTQIIATFIETENGNEWCSVVLTYILEALLLDPIYGANANEAGWKWLQHTPGLPRANEETRYDQIMQTVRKDHTNL